MASLTRTLFVCAVLSWLVLLGYWLVSAGLHRSEVAELEAMNRQMQERLDAREEMIARLGRSRRLAHIEILDQRIAVGAGDDVTTLLFVEIDDDGAEIARQEFTIPGNVLFVDAWTVKFDANDVAHGHPLSGKTLVLLRRIYSDRIAPAHGLPIDTPGAVPPGYASSDLSRFEKSLWAQFWQIATDPGLAAAMGVRVAQGEAVYKPVRAGQTFDLTVDAVGGISLMPTAAIGMESGRGG